MRIGCQAGCMTNTCELPINAVTNDKPKMLTGLNQKVCGRLRQKLKNASLTGGTYSRFFRERLTSKLDDIVKSKEM
jgi:hypothetical protein